MLTIVLATMYRIQHVLKCSPTNMYNSNIFKDYHHKNQNGKILQHVKLPVVFWKEMQPLI